MKRKAHVYIVLEFDATMPPSTIVHHVLASRKLAEEVKEGLEKKHSTREYGVIKKTILDATAITRTIVLFPKET